MTNRSARAGRDRLRANRIRLLLIGLLAGTFAAASSSADSETSKVELDVGQVWKYETRKDEDDSRVIILKLERDDVLGTIVHVHVTEIRFDPNSSASGAIGHLPYQEAALVDSLVELDPTRTEFPDFEEGHRVWRAAFDREEAGAFTVPLRDAVEFAVQTTQGR